MEQLARHAAEYPLLLLPPFLIAIIDAHQASSNDAAILSSRGDRIVARTMLFIHWRETTLGGPSACGSPMARQFGKAFLGPGPGRESAAGGNAAGSRQIPLWGPIVWQYHLTQCPWICPQEGGTRTKGVSSDAPRTGRNGPSDITGGARDDELGIPGGCLNGVCRGDNVWPRI